MKIYQSTGSADLLVSDVENEEKDVGKIKIKVTQVMPTLSDLNTFTGSVKRDYPCVFGHMAIGAVSDDRPEYGLKRGTRVILNPYVVEAFDRLDSPPLIKTSGVNCDGFLKDFVHADIDKITPFPDNVEEFEAIFTEKIAVALSAVNAFRIAKGDYIAVIGGTPLCNIIAQLALYFQLVPIMIDTGENRLKRAENVGIFYTVNSLKEVPFDRVKEITGGRMCNHTVFDASSGQAGAYLFALAKDGGDCVLICENGTAKTLDADISPVGKNRLRLKGVADGAAEFDSAINILAQRILNLRNFIDVTADIGEADRMLKEYSAEPELYYSAVIKL